VSKYVIHMQGSTLLRGHLKKAANSISTLNIVITKMPALGPMTMHKGRMVAGIGERRVAEALDSKLLQGEEEGEYILALDLSFDKE